MPRLTADQWASIRAEREASGMSFADLGAKYGVSAPAIFKRAKAEGWGNGQDVGDAIRRKVNELVHGVNEVSPKKRAEAIDAAAERTVAVLETHRAEWAEHRQLFPTAEIKADFELGKSAKISAEMLRIRQSGERLAYGLDTTETRPTVVIERSFGGL